MQNPPLPASKLVSEAELRIRLQCDRVDLFDAVFDADSYFAIAIPLTGIVKGLMDSKVSQARKKEIAKRFACFRSMVDKDVPTDQKLTVKYTKRHRDAILFIMDEWDRAKSHISKENVARSFQEVFGNLENKLSEQ